MDGKRGKITGLLDVHKGLNYFQQELFIRRFGYGYDHTNKL